VRDLEARFGTTRVVAAPVERRWRAWAFAGVATAAAVIAGAFLLAHGDHDDQGVTTLPTAATTTTVISTTSTAAVSTTTSIAESPTTTAAHAATTTSTSTTVLPPPTTTTTAPAQDLGLQCTTNPNTDAVVCEWHASGDPAFDHFRLWKHTGDGPDQELYAGTTARYEDHELSGARKYYEVEALAADGRVLGHGETFVICC
jgi:hypothetical protein